MSNLREIYEFAMVRTRGGERLLGKHLADVEEFEWGYRLINSEGNWDIKDGEWFGYSYDHDTYFSLQGVLPDEYMTGLPVCFIEDDGLYTYYLEEGDHNELYPWEINEEYVKSFLEEGNE